MRVILFCFALISCSAFGQSLTFDIHLQGYYKFDGNAADSSGYNRHGAAFNGVTYSADNFGSTNGAADFDGINDYINTFFSFDYQQRTVAAWLLPRQMSGSIGTSTERVAIDQNANTLQYGTAKMFFHSGGLGMLAGGEGTSSVNPHNYSGVSLNQWIHVAMVRDIFTTRYYVNGVLVGSGVAGILGSSANAYQNMVVGSGRTRMHQFFDGKVDELRIYNTALTTNQINDLFNFDPNASPCLVTVYDTITTTYYDTVRIFEYVTVPVYDTTFITHFDTSLVTLFDTIKVEITTGLVGAGNQVGLIIYPNPTTDNIYFDAADILTYNHDVFYTLFNSFGQTVLNGQIFSPNMSISLSQLGISKGTYFLEIDAEFGKSKKVYKIFYQ